MVGVLGPAGLGLHLDPTGDLSDHRPEPTQIPRTLGQTGLNGRKVVRVNDITMEIRHESGRDTLGVAHRSLPCGTKVSLLYQGRTITVPVIDRGPYAKGIAYDLTEKTARALRMLSTGTIRAGH